MVTDLRIHRFKSTVAAEHDVPLIAINMGAVGKLSRILNSFMTPVSHPVSNLLVLLAELVYSLDFKLRQY